MNRRDDGAGLLEHPPGEGKKQSARLIPAHARIHSVGGMPVGNVTGGSIGPVSDVELPEE